MKKTNVLFSFFAKGKTLILSTSLILMFFLAGSSSAYAQTLNLKNATPLQVVQEELNIVQAGLGTLSPGHSKAIHYAPYVTYLQTIIQKLSSGMSYHAAIATSNGLRPQWLTQVPGLPQSSAAKPGQPSTNSRVSVNPKN